MCDIHVSVPAAAAAALVCPTAAAVVALKRIPQVVFEGGANVEGTVEGVEITRTLLVSEPLHFGGGLQGFGRWGPNRHPE